MTLSVSRRLRFHCTGSLLVRYKSVPFPRVYIVPDHFRSDTKVFLSLAFTLYRITFDPIQKCSFPSRLHCTGSLSIRYKSVPFPRVYIVPDHFRSDTKVFLSLAFTLYRITFDPIQKCSFPSRLHCTGSLLIRYKSVPFPRLYIVPDHFRSDTKVFLSLAFTLYRITFDPIQKCSFPSRLHCTGSLSIRYKSVPFPRVYIVPDHF